MLPGGNTKPSQSITVINTAVFQWSRSPPSAAILEGAEQLPLLHHEELALTDTLLTMNVFACSFSYIMSIKPESCQYIISHKSVAGCGQMREHVFATPGSVHSRSNSLTLILLAAEVNDMDRKTAKSQAKNSHIKLMKGV